MAGRTTHLTRALRRVEPPSRAIDWSIFASVVFETLSGMLSLGAGHPANGPLFAIHGVIGLSLVVLVGFKLYRARRRVLDARLRDRHTAPLVLLAVIAFASLSTGIAWMLGVEVRIDFWTLLNVYIGFSLLVVPALFFHLWARFRPPRRVDFAKQHRALQHGAMLVFNATTYRATKTVGALRGMDRRFTGSRPLPLGEGNNAFPVTSWVADSSNPIDPDSWSLSVTGLVDRSPELNRADLVPGETRSVLLDCTSGWYTKQHWTGVRPGDTLDAAGVHSSAW